MLDIIVLIISSAIIVAVPCFLVFQLKRYNDEDKHDELYKFIEIAVCAAEQVISGTGKGRDKKQFVQDFLSCQGLEGDPIIISTFIESAVYTNLNRNNKKPVPDGQKDRSKFITD